MIDYQPPARPGRLPSNSFGQNPSGGPPPVFNLMPGVKSLIIVLFVIHLAQRLMPTALDAQLEDMLGYFPHRYWLLLHGQWAGPLFLAVVTPLTYMFLHANWVHLGINVMSLAAFGTVVERLVGARMMIWLFVLCGVAGAFAEFAIDPSADTIVIGASAGISGLFAIAFLTMLRSQTASRTVPLRKLVGATILIIMTMIVMGKVGLMGMTIAWVSHIGGFMAGLVADACISRRDGNTPLRDIGWFAAIITLPLLVLAMNVSKYF